MGGLALALALLTYGQTGVWRSERALWSRAHQVAPLLPRPLIGLAWAQFDAGDLGGAERTLQDAWPLTDRQAPSERDWSRDAIDATQALIWLRQGRLYDAAGLMAAGPKFSERWKLCQHFAAICALASPSSPSAR